MELMCLKSFPSGVTVSGRRQAVQESRYVGAERRSRSGLSARPQAGLQSCLPSPGCGSGFAGCRRRGNADLAAITAVIPTYHQAIAEAVIRPYNLFVETSRQLQHQHRLPR